MSVLEGLPRDASAQAVGEAEVLVVTPGALLVRLRRDPTFAFELLRRLSGRVRSLNARLVSALGQREPAGNAAGAATSDVPDSVSNSVSGRTAGAVAGRNGSKSVSADGGAVHAESLLYQSEAKSVEGVER
jgi:CRP-like cAMP-binding protein